MVSLICSQKLKEELSDFYNNIDENVIEKLKQLCILYDINEERIASQLLAFVTKGNDSDSLDLAFIERFETDYLNKNAIIAERNASTKRIKNFNISKISFKDDDDDQFTSMRKQLFKDYSQNKLTTQIEIASNEQQLSEFINIKTPEKSIKKEIEFINVKTLEKSIKKEIEFINVKTPEKIIKEEMDCGVVDVSCMTTPQYLPNESINTFLKSDDRTNILCYFGASQADNAWKNQSNIKFKHEYYNNKLEMNEIYKFMTLRIGESNEIMSNYIDEFSENYSENYDIDSWAQFNVDNAAEDYYIGRVKYDLDKNKLDENSVLLEGSDFITKSENIKLDLSLLSHYSLFPGQVIACKAMNENLFGDNGRKLIVREILAAEKTLSHSMQAPKLTQPLDIVVAVGPFVTSETQNLLKSIIKYAKQYEPNFLILFGPFTDSQSIKFLNIEDINNYFSIQMKLIDEELCYAKTETIIIPSIRDINNFNVLPTMPFTGSKYQKINFYPNPVVLNINGIIIGMTSTDILMHLTKEEIFANYDNQSTDRLGRLCNHILCQKNFYPLFPPNDEINVEFTKYGFLRLPVTPHLLILPSDLKQFIKNISGTIAINCGRVSKSIARIKIDAINESNYNGSIENFTNVEILKLID